MSGGGWALLPRKGDRRTGRFIRDCTAEILGTFSLIFWGCGSTGTGQSDLHIAFGFGLGIATAVHIFSDISGAHFNPAVSLALFVAQKVSLLRCLIYIICQFLGGFLASALLYGICGRVPGTTRLGSYHEMNCNVVDGAAITCVVKNKHDITTGIGFILELFGTLLLVFLILATTNEKRGQSTSYHQPLSIGICIFVIHLVLVPLTGCGINPVRGIVPNIIDETVQAYHWIYVIAPLLASVIGALAYLLLFDPHYPPKHQLSKILEMEETIVVNNGAS